MVLSLAFLPWTHGDGEDQTWGEVEVEVEVEVDTKDLVKLSCRNESLFFLFVSSRLTKASGIMDNNFVYVYFSVSSCFRSRKR